MAAPGRTCGECQVCCVTFHVWGLPREVPRWQPCYHQCEQGCAIHPDRPDGWRWFECAWLAGWGEDDDRPDRLGVMLELKEARPRIGVEASVLATEALPGGAQGERARRRLREWADERRVVLVDFGARGKDTWGRDLPADT